MFLIPRKLFALVALIAIATASCGSAEVGSAATEATADDPGVRLVSAADGRSLQENPPTDLVVLDVRTPDEFADGHLDGAIMIDFYEEDFADQLAELDPNASYLLYCRSGNRSGQTAAILDELGFTDVADVDGGIIAWTAAGHPVVNE